MLAGFGAGRNTCSHVMRSSDHRGTRGTRGGCGERGRRAGDLLRGGRKGSVSRRDAEAQSSGCGCEFLRAGMASAFDVLVRYSVVERFGVGLHRLRGGAAFVSVARSVCGEAVELRTLKRHECRGPVAVVGGGEAFLSGQECPRSFLEVSMAVAADPSGVGRASPLASGVRVCG